VLKYQLVAPGINEPERPAAIVRMEQAFAHWAVNEAEDKSNIDLLLRDKDFISPLMELGWKASNYDSLVAIDKMGTYIPKGGIERR
jgi:hypothetical protein